MSDAEKIASLEQRVADLLDRVKALEARNTVVVIPGVYGPTVAPQPARRAEITCSAPGRATQ